MCFFSEPLLLEIFSYFETVKVLQIIVGILLLGISIFNGMMLYAQFQYYMLFHDRSTNMYGPPITNEFYIVLISTTVLAVMSIPTLIYQTKQIFQSPPQKPDDDLIDADNIEFKVKSTNNRFLYNSTKFYAFALLTQIILLGKRSSSVLSKMQTLTHWFLLIGFMLSAFVAIYFLAVSKRSSE